MKPFLYLCIFVLFALPFVSHADFDRQFDLSLRAGRDLLTNDEKKELLEENDTLLMQISDPHTSRLLHLFGGLPDSLINDLKEATYLKWKYTDLDEQRKAAFRSAIELNVSYMKRQDIEPEPGFSVKALKDAVVGFAIVEIPEIDDKVVSWYILLPDYESPLWVTVVNAGVAGTPEYFQAHRKRLPLLRAMPTSNVP